MTRILSLGQNSGLTVMILNLAPTRAYHLDTLASLNFASRTKKIEVSEVENDPIYRALTKPLAATSSIGGANIARQPLRPLAAAHNANIQEVDKKKQGQKPNKAFSVYSDSRKPGMRGSNLGVQNPVVRRLDTHKRAAESGVPMSRPAKTSRTADNTSRTRPFDNAMTKESIEAMISQRIDEKLAEKALQDAAVAAPALSAELQRRLDDLEQRVEARDDDKSGPGLQFLLMGKQHLTRGEEVSALRMFQLALPYFSGNSRLEAKIAKLEETIRSRREAGSGLPHAAPTHALVRMAPLPTKQKKMSSGDETEDDEFAPMSASDHDESYASDSSFKFKKPARKIKSTTKKLPIFRDQDEVSYAATPEDQTPRTTRLLKIINTKDVTQIKALKGVGAKKADAIVNCLVDMDDAEIRDLQMLAMFKGVGGKSVETMRLGLTMEF
jgi:DNA uptake protein ComE-like DNA-binding protein